ncbi:Nif3-like dinuclear metal center hexameric protein [Nemorincola caseinilytica]|uniref:GTP cyclohydrolase 1 type 2 homolog n=1 Tax=Nemorincola caseinilytica TaxID=2054315 RepID=A0ABP8NGG9_9BACT
MTVKDIMEAIEAVAPIVYQESYDNSGLQVGDAAAIVTGVLITLDVTEQVVDEALGRGCNMIVAHHPLIFGGLKRVTGRTYVERIVAKAIKNDIHIYAAHTNLDNVAQGVNARFAQKLGLQDTRILVPKSNLLYRLCSYAPTDVADGVREAMFHAGAGHISKYSECSFNTEGTGTFRAAPDADPAIGTPGGGRENVREVKIEVIVTVHNKNAVIAAMRAAHIYEEVAYELIPLANPATEIGAGMIGTLAEPLEEIEMLSFIKQQMRTECIRHTELTGRAISRVAVCGGSGSFLLRDAIAAGADIFITADHKYHQFFDAEKKILIADIGHYQSEQYTSEIFEEILKKNFPNFAVLLSNLSTDPVKYFC